MRRFAHLVLVLFLGATALVARAQDTKFGSSTGNDGLSGRYRVSVALLPGDELDAISRQLAATYGGRLEPYAELGFVGFAIRVSESRARLLASDPRVIAVEELEPSNAMLPQPSAAPVERVAAEATRPSMKIATEAVSGFGTYTYDGSGNITSIGDAMARDSFVYDELGRLKNATLREGAGQTYTYDRYGNILTIVTAGDSVTKRLGVNKYTNRIDQLYDDSGQLNTEVGSYDSRGNLIAYGSGTFVYDGLDMVKESTVPIAGEGVVRRFHIYSASDERVLTMTPVASGGFRSDWTIRDPGGRVLRRFTQTSTGFTWAEDYIYRGGQLLATAVPGPEKIRHFHLDHLGTPRLITGNGGAQVAQHHYQPFGPEVSPSTIDGEKAKFTGHERDAATLDYMHARYYDPYLGRFLSVDPVRSAKLGIPQSWNRYAYARNNPLKFVDPDGREVTYANDHMKQLFSRLEARYGNVRATLDRYRGEGKPDLLITRGNAGVDIDGRTKALGVFKPNFNWTTDAAKIDAAGRKQDESSILPATGKFVAAGATLTNATIVMGDTLTPGSKQEQQVALHELGHAESAAKDPNRHLELGADDVIRPDGKLLEHDKRPLEEEANRYRDDIHRPPQ